MKILFFGLSLIPLIAQGALLSYTPGALIEKTISTDYYDTDYIFIDHFGVGQIYVGFELIENTTPNEWSVTGCTNTICYVKVPGEGLLGDIGNGQQGYISINLAVNEHPGSGTIRFAVFDVVNPALRDTISFIYHVEETGTSKPQPWAHINFSQNTLTVFVANEGVETSLKVFTLSGELVFSNQQLNAINSVSFVDFRKGVYVAIVEEKNGRKQTYKLPVF